MIIGGQAVLLYGEPRLTKDIDITLGIGIDRWKIIEKAAKSIHLRPLVAKIEDFVKDNMVFPAIDDKSGIRVDFIFSYSPYERQAIERARGIYFGQTEVKFAALEDVVIHKMIAGRARDIEDVESILLKNPDFDACYIEKWLDEFDRSLGKNFKDAFSRLKQDLKKQS
jgi:hypothetical protein